MFSFLLIIAFDPYFFPVRWGKGGAGIPLPAKVRTSGGEVGFPVRSPQEATRSPLSLLSFLQEPHWELQSPRPFEIPPKIWVGEERWEREGKDAASAGGGDVSLRGPRGGVLGGLMTASTRDSEMSKDTQALSRRWDPNEMKCSSLLQELFHET